MTCGEARQYIFAFLDNELDAGLSLEVQRHIEQCPHCARECEIENVIRRQLAAKLRDADETPAFDEAALLGIGLSGIGRSNAPVASRAHRKSRRHWLFGSTVAMAAVFLLAVTLFITNPGGYLSQQSLADALVDDFEHFVTESKPLEIVSGDVEEVSRWLRERTALAVHMPAVDSTIGELWGGRKCKINSSAAAFAVYRVGNELVSVVALPGSDQALASMKRIDRNGHIHWVDHCRGHTVLACSRGELIYAVVSRLPEESLWALMPSAEG